MSNTRQISGAVRRALMLSAAAATASLPAVAQVKPDPELYLLALARLGLEPHEAIVFEDAPNGVLAAKPG